MLMQHLVVELSFLSFVYGDPVVKYRELVWEIFIRIGTQRSKPWLMIVDFNELTENHEKKGGVM